MFIGEESPITLPARVPDERTVGNTHPPVRKAPRRESGTETILTGVAPVKGEKCREVMELKTIATLLAPP